MCEKAETHDREDRLHRFNDTEPPAVALDLKVPATPMSAGDADGVEETLMLRPGDRVYIHGTGEEGVVKEVHTNDVVVRVQTAARHDERSYSHESLRLAPRQAESALLFA